MSKLHYLFVLLAITNAFVILALLSFDNFGRYNTFTKFARKTSNTNDLNVFSSSREFSSIVYLKTHKTGSTTMQNLFRKYLKSRKEKVPIVAEFPVPFVGGYPGHIRFKFIKHKGEIGAIVSHCRFDADDQHRYMPNNTKYFTIIREPWAQFQSAYNYFARKFPKLKTERANCLHMPSAFVRNGRNLDPVTFMHECARTLNKSVPWYFRFKNYQAHDLGFDPMLEDKEEIEKQIKALDANMNLVLINEHLKESLILLKDILDMTWSEILLKENTYATYEKMKLGKYDEQIFSEHNKIDIALYRHFNATLWKKIDSYGRERMAEDILTYDEETAKHRQVMPKERKKRRRKGGIKNLPLPEDLKNYMRENSGTCLWWRPKKGRYFLEQNIAT